MCHEHTVTRVAPSAGPGPSSAGDPRRVQRVGHPSPGERASAGASRLRHTAARRFPILCRKRQRRMSPRDHPNTTHTATSPTALGQAKAATARKFAIRIDRSVEGTLASAVSSPQIHLSRLVLGRTHARLLWLQPRPSLVRPAGPPPAGQRPRRRGMRMPFRLSGFLTIRGIGGAASSRRSASATCCSRSCARL